METTASSQQTNTDKRVEIMRAYREYVLLNGKQPPSVFAFCKDLEISESEFYEYFNDFGSISSAFWKDHHNEVIREIMEGEEFNDFTAREKLLSYYYGFFSNMQEWRSFAILSFNESMKPLQKDSRHLRDLKESFKNWVQEIIDQGQRNGEIASRAMLSNNYPDIFWLQFLFLMNFWRKDNSKGFIKTDAAIEKSVHLSFDLIEKNALDSALDFGKFLFQNR